MKDTGILLKEAVHGCKAAEQSITIAKQYAEDRGLIMALDKYQKEHEAISKQLSEQMRAMGIKVPIKQTVSAAVSKAHTNISLSMNPESDNIAKLMINGCSAGMKMLSRMKNRHPSAAPESISLTNALIRTERDMIDDMLRYLK